MFERRAFHGMRWTFQLLQHILPVVICVMSLFAVLVFVVFAIVKLFPVQKVVNMHLFSQVSAVMWLFM